jgi:hypothetical protein
LFEQLILAESGPSKWLHANHLNDCNYATSLILHAGSQFLNPATATDLNNTIRRL